MRDVDGAQRIERGIAIEQIDGDRNDVRHGGHRVARHSGHLPAQLDQMGREVAADDAGMTDDEGVKWWGHGVTRV